MADADALKVTVKVLILVGAALFGMGVEYTRTSFDSQRYADTEVKILGEKIDESFIRRETFEATMATVRSDIAGTKAEIKGDVAALSAQIEGMRAAIESLTRREDAKDGR